ncbi:unnamed protein product [Angiostrongylus costaricensis]|uniref:Caenorhabditis elegans ly-6-related family-containing protein n=1 Tax=Angiostrongylus costaricensis TaxID=334426 RepID=A0A0R3PQJ7_ANGCS|nr:unnamed protein product [Angiostrongylus costaricensis]
MSRLYEVVWPSLSYIYKRPKNFTDDCNDDRISKNHVPIVYCDTICVSMYEAPNIAGVRIGGHIRGCMKDVLIRGFNETIVSWYRWMHRDSCRSYRKKELFKLEGEQIDESTIDVCTCYADYCNGNSGQHPSVLYLAMMLANAVLLLVFF